MSLRERDWLSISAFARAYGVDRGTVYKWLKSELLDTYRVGKLERIRNLTPDQHQGHVIVERC